MAAAEPRRIDHPDQTAYPGAYVVLPAAWLGEHFVTRDMAVAAAERFHSPQLTRACIALCLAEAWGGLPGLVGMDPADWNLAKMPADLLVWLDTVVVGDFSKVYLIPKASAAPSSNGSTATVTTAATAGS